MDRRIARNTRRKRIAFIAALFLAFAQFTFAQSGQDAGTTGEADVSAPQAAAPTGDLPPGVTAETVYAGTVIPKIYPRSVWDSYQWTGSAWQPSDALRNSLTWLPAADNQPPDYFRVERIVVHDQGCLNPATCIANAEKYPVQIIQNVFRSHAITRGWGDIGYNYVIDRQGRIFEGKYGGNGVRGAHVYADARCENLNVGTAGVLLLGDLRGGPMTQAQSDSLSRLAGWIGAANGVDITETNATSQTWRNPRKATGGCDLTQGGFTGTITAPRLVSHGDVETGNSDFFDLSPQRLAARSAQTALAALVFQGSGTATAYNIRDGALQEAAAANAGTPAPIAQTQLDMFQRASVSTLSDGTLVKSKTLPRIYVIEGGQRRAIPTADLFVLKGYRWDAVQELSDRELSLIRSGLPVPYPDNALVKGSGEEVYVFEGAQLHHITSAALFEAFKYAWTSVKKLFDSDLNQYPKGDPKLFPDGTLVKSVTPRVYRIEQAQRKPVLSAALFTSLGFQWSDIKTLSSGELARYPEGKAYVWPDGTIIRAQGDEKVYLMQQGYRRWIQTGEAFTALGYQWKDVRLVSPEEITSATEAQPIANLNDHNLIPQPLVVAPPPPPPPPPLTPGTEPVIRIGLSVIGADKHPGSQVTLSADGAATLKKNGTVVISLSANQQYTFTPGAGEIWRLEPETPGVIAIASYSDLAYNGSNDNRFRGIVEVQASNAGTLWLINELPIESYLKGIAETVNGDPPEYSKAFAIMARSYGYYYVLKGGKRAGEPFTIRRTSDDQLYKGYNFELRAQDPVAGVLATRGIVSMFNGKPVLAAYSSGAPGPTKSACEALSSSFCNNPDFAYLNGGVSDPPDTVFKAGATCGVNGNHCAGVDAAGGRRMAELGSIAKQILTTYYPGTSVAQQW